MIDYGRLAWAKTQKEMTKHADSPGKADKLLLQFKTLWCKRQLPANSSALLVPQWTPL